MLVHTGQTVHFGVGCVFSPQPVLDADHILAFQGDLAKHGLVFTQTQAPPGLIALIRETRPIEVRVQHIGPGVGSLAVVAPAPWASLDEFLDEAHIAFSGFRTLGPGSPCRCSSASALSDAFLA